MTVQFKLNFKRLPSYNNFSCTDVRGWNRMEVVKVKQLNLLITMPRYFGKMLSAVELCTYFFCSMLL
jgi:hypothetical protein